LIKHSLNQSSSPVASAPKSVIGAQQTDQALAEIDRFRPHNGRWNSVAARLVLPRSRRALKQARTAELGGKRKYRQVRTADLNALLDDLVSTGEQR
jgi:hypothetical protein